MGRMGVSRYDENGAAGFDLRSCFGRPRWQNSRMARLLADVPWVSVCRAMRHDVCDCFAIVSW